MPSRRSPQLFEAVVLFAAALVAAGPAAKNRLTIGPQADNYGGPIVGRHASFESLLQLAGK
jgi:hypothetical protein